MKTSEHIFITIFLNVKYNELTFGKKNILNLPSQAFSILIFIKILLVTKVEPTGLGGTINVHFQCNGCEIRSLAFQGSSVVEGSKRTVVGLALGVAFFLTGHGFANFERTLKQC